MWGRRPPRPPLTTSLDGRDEPADVDDVVVTVRLEKTTFTRFPSGTNFSVPKRPDFRREHTSRFEIRCGNRHRHGSLSARKRYKRPGPPLSSQVTCLHLPWDWHHWQRGPLPLAVLPVCQGYAEYHHHLNNHHHGVHSDANSLVFYEGTTLGRWDPAVCCRLCLIVTVAVGRFHRRTTHKSYPINHRDWCELWTRVIVCREQWQQVTAQSWETDLISWHQSDTTLSLNVF